MTPTPAEGDRHRDGGSGASGQDAALLAEIDAELAAERASRPRASARTVGAVLLIGGLGGWIAALALFMDKIFLLENPGASLGCDINPFISCGTVMNTWQASALGIPNMAVGLGGFAIMGAIGALMLSGATLPGWFRWARLGGMTFAFALVHFLAVSAIFVIRALCPWCMVVWAVTAPMFFATLAHTVESGDLRLPAPLAAVLRRWVLLTIAWYLLVLLVIAAAFWNQWLATFGIA
ncbi:vitamin K epoxide reductase family protein [Brachybacterium sp. NBEC-018]|uniref:vitamin K epoxide reductase family protein n=1 Tax=Brachybacterium sp. NBEC-018 TaxID=2996004 RepID=UPI0021751430|nr:vitamin K epoxide reductase family protein [Brachybacterium sp. NBEC-018]UVY82801.1 vitamin K epoxide reductase family protein [Brachybacterium sp. NBEC-018]